MGREAGGERFSSGSLQGEITQPWESCVFSLESSRLCIERGETDLKMI